MDGRLAMRHADRERLEAIYGTVERDPGIKAGKVARRLKIARSAVTRALPALEAEGMLLSEDGKGRLWPWGRQK
jgi:Mn-dependent DtxR family transcriptional regulator